MFDIGIGEILVMAVIGLVIFGPEKLPTSIAELAKTLRRLREMSASARSDLAKSSGIDLGEVQSTLGSLSELHPRRILDSALKEPTRTAEGTQADRSRQQPEAS